VWIYRRIKNREAPFMCVIRVAQPISLSRIIFTMVVKAVEVSAL